MKVQQVVKFCGQKWSNFGAKKKLPKKLAHRKKSTILRILDSNFKLKLAIQKNSGSRNFRKIRYLEPPQIDLRTRPKLGGTNGISSLNMVASSYSFGKLSFGKLRDVVCLLKNLVQNIYKGSPS